MDEQLESLIRREQISLASIRQRAAAFGIDELLLSVIMIVILWDTMAQAKTLEAMIAVTNSFLLEYMAIKIVYQTFFTMQYGATIGKIVMKIRVIEIATLSNPGFLSAASAGHRKTVRGLHPGHFLFIHMRVFITGSFPGLYAESMHYEDFTDSRADLIFTASS